MWMAACFLLLLVELVSVLKQICKGFWEGGDVRWGGIQSSGYMHSKIQIKVWIFAV